MFSAQLFVLSKLRIPEQNVLKFNFRGKKINQRLHTPFGYERHFLCIFFCSECFVVEICAEVNFLFPFFFSDTRPIKDSYSPL